MKASVRRVEYPDVEAYRELYRAEAQCQIIHDSALRRGMADPYLFEIDGAFAGYGAVWNQYYVGQVMEFYTLPARRHLAYAMFPPFHETSGATTMEAQSNMPEMALALLDHGSNLRVENVIFGHIRPMGLTCPGAALRRQPEEDHASHWVVEMEGSEVASGGYLTHYNPPYADIYMEVKEDWRRRGIGSWLVQELIRICYDEGKRPAARCNASNVASRRTITRAGLLPCARLMVGDLQ